MTSNLFFAEHRKVDESIDKERKFCQVLVETFQFYSNCKQVANFAFERSNEW